MDSVCESRPSNDIMLFVDRQLSGYDYSLFPIAVLKDLEQRQARQVIKLVQPEVIVDQQPCFIQLVRPIHVGAPSTGSYRDTG